MDVDEDSSSGTIAAIVSSVIVILIIISAILFLYVKKRKITLKNKLNRSDRKPKKKSAEKQNEMSAAYASETVSNFYNNNA